MLGPLLDPPELCSTEVDCRPSLVLTCNEMRVGLERETEHSMLGRGCSALANGLADKTQSKSCIFWGSALSLIPAQRVYVNSSSTSPNTEQQQLQVAKYLGASSGVSSRRL